MDLETLFNRLRQDDDIQNIKYFTARIIGPHKINQNAYLDVLENSPKVEIIYGLFKPKKVKCLVQNCKHQGNRVFSMPEEKRTDVNIAVHIIDDAYNDKADRIILVSGDSDLVPALKLVRKLFPNIQITVYIPANNKNRGAASELRKQAHRHKILPNQLIKISQFPEKVTFENGSVIHKPTSW